MQASADSLCHISAWSIWTSISPSDLHLWALSLKVVVQIMHMTKWIPYLSFKQLPFLRYDRMSHADWQRSFLTTVCNYADYGRYGRVFRPEFEDSSVYELWHMSCLSFMKFHSFNFYDSVFTFWSSNGGHALCGICLPKVNLLQPSFLDPLLRSSCPHNPEVWRQMSVPELYMKPNFFA